MINSVNYGKLFTLIRNSYAHRKTFAYCPTLKLIYIIRQRREEEKNGKKREKTQEIYKKLFNHGIINFPT